MYNPSLTYKTGNGELGSADIELHGATMIDNSQMQVKEQKTNTKWIIMAIAIAVAAVAVLMVSRRTAVE